MRDSEHRPEKFHGISLGVPKTDEARAINGAHRRVQAPTLVPGSVVEDAVCLGDTVNDLRIYFNSLTDAEIIAVHANMIFPNMPAGAELTQRTIKRLGVEEERLKRIREEMTAIILS